MVMGAKGMKSPHRLGDWLARAVNTTYQADTDGFVTAWGIPGGGTEEAAILTDAATPPTIKRVSNYETSGAPHTIGCSSPIKKGDYWKELHASNVYWIPLE